MAHGDRLVEAMAGAPTQRDAKAIGAPDFLRMIGNVANQESHAPEKQTFCVNPYGVWRVERSV